MNNWILRDLLTSTIFEIVLFVLAFLTGFARDKYPRAVRGILYSLGAFALVIVALAGIQVMTYVNSLPPQPPIITPDNVEQYVQNWLAARHYGVHEVRVDDLPAVKFRLDATNPNDPSETVQIVYMKVDPTFLHLDVPLGTTEFVPFYNKFTTDQQSDLKTTISFQLASAKLQFVSDVPNSITVFHDVAVDNLRETSLVEAVDDTMEGALMTRDAVVLDFSHLLGGQSKFGPELAKKLQK